MTCSTNKIDGSLYGSPMLLCTWCIHVSGAKILVCTPNRPGNQNFVTIRWSLSTTLLKCLPLTGCRPLFSE